MVDPRYNLDQKRDELEGCPKKRSECREECMKEGGSFSDCLIGCSTEHATVERFQNTTFGISNTVIIGVALILAIMFMFPRKR